MACFATSSRNDTIRSSVTVTSSTHVLLTIAGEPLMDVGVLSMNRFIVRPQISN